jgi:hypothetical protein
MIKKEDAQTALEIIHSDVLGISKISNHNSVIQNSIIKGMLEKKRNDMPQVLIVTQVLGCIKTMIILELQRLILLDNLIADTGVMK